MGLDITYDNRAFYRRTSFRVVWQKLGQNCLRKSFLLWASSLKGHPFSPEKVHCDSQRHKNRDENVSGPIREENFNEDFEELDPP